MSDHTKNLPEIFLTRLGKLIKNKQKAEGKETQSPLSILTEALQSQVTIDTGDLTPDIRKQTLIGWLHGRAMPDHVNVVRIARAFGASTDYLYGITDYPTIAKPRNKDALILPDPKWRPVQNDDGVVIVDNLPIAITAAVESSGSTCAPRFFLAQMFDGDSCTGCEFIMYDCSDTELADAHVFVFDLMSVILVRRVERRGPYVVRLWDDQLNVHYEVEIANFEDREDFKVLGRLLARARF